MPYSRFAERKAVRKIKFENHEPLIKVLIGSSQGSCTYITNVDCLLFEGDEKIGIIKKHNNISITSHKNEIKLSVTEKHLTDTLFTLTPVNEDEFFTYNGKRYRGSLQIGSEKNSVFFVNSLSLEEYLQGVLPVELGNSETKNIDAALEAFAIVARTFAIEKCSDKNRLYNIEATTNAQLYAGQSAEKEVFNQAIKKTESLILTYKNEIAEPFYSSSCGGTTEDATNVFSKRPIPYLTSHSDSDPGYCSNSPVYAWTETYTGAQFKKYVLKNDEQQKEITDVAITKQFPSGRVSELTISFDDSTSQILTSKNVRQVIRRPANGAILRSSLFTIDVQKTDSIVTKIVLHGKGNGHGVGLCQWGSFTMARLGFTMKEILDFYFPGTEIMSLHDQ